MKPFARGLFVAVALVCLCIPASAQEKIENWPAPALWSPPVDLVKEADTVGTEAVEAVPTPPLHFVGLTPCRLADTRGNGFTGAYGPPALTQGAQRSFVLTGRCGISATAQAVSLNVTVTNTQGPGHILIYPTGGAQPTVSTLNYVAGQTIANAAVVPLGTGGAITVVAGVSGTDLILDTNGDYRGGVVTSLNGITGAVTLTEGSNVTITPSGQTLTIDSTGGPGGLLPTGTSNQTLRHNGTSWVASSAFTNAGTFFEMTGNLNMKPSVNIGSGPLTFLRDAGSGSTLLGVSTFTTGADNTYVGSSAGGVGSGSGNVALGSLALSGLTTGGGNIAIGYNVGTAVSTGSNNLYIGNPGSGNESGQIRIGSNAVHTQGTVIASIYGFGSSGGIPVIVNSGGRLGTTTSSIRFKEDVYDLGAASAGLMKLRPVAFRYKESDLQEYGLIAEEVAKVYPELVVNDDQGRPMAIRSQLLDPLLLNELQKQRAEIDELREELAKLRAELSAK